MKKIRKLLTLVLAIAMILSLGSSALASNDDWADYQQYVYSFAAAGAPTPKDAASMAAIISATFRSAQRHLVTIIMLQ